MTLSLPVMKHENGCHRCRSGIIVCGDTVAKGYNLTLLPPPFIVQELCESRGGRPELSVLTNLLVSVDVKLY